MGFQRFFSCLTNIRCAVVEGGHRCEAASQNLLGYQLGDPIPLELLAPPVPQTSTLFQQAQTVAYYSQDKDVPLDQRILDYLKAISKKISDQKMLIFGITWHNFLKRVTVEIIDSFNLEPCLYETPEDFFLNICPTEKQVIQ